MKRQLSVDKIKEIKQLLEHNNVKEVALLTGVGKVMVRNLRDDFKRTLFRKNLIS